MILLSRYAHIPPAESDQLTDDQAFQLAKVTDAMVAQERDFLVELVLGAAKIVADTTVKAVMARG